MTQAKKEFTWVNWKEKDLEKEAKGILDKKKKIYKEVKSIPANERNFENTVLAIEQSSYETADKLYKIDFLMYVSPDKKIRNKAQQLSSKIREEWIDLDQDKELWRALKEYRDKKEKINGPDKKLSEDMYREFKRRGYDLPKGKRMELLLNLKKLTKLSTLFEKNINEYKNYILISKNDTAGLPLNYLKRLKKKGGKYIVGLSYPEYFPFMEYADNEKNRKELAEKFFQRAGTKNLTLMEKILDIRFKNSKILGYKNPAEYEIEEKMAKSAQNVYEFLNDIKTKAAHASRKDLRELLDLKKALKGGKTGLRHHDISYLARLLKEKKFNLNKEEIKSHFQFDIVKRGVFDVYSKLLGVNFKKADSPVWHSDVERYDVLEKNGKNIATFFMDMFPREGKYGHAAAFSIRSGRMEENNYIKPVSALVMNVAKPQADLPSLLTHSEVETFFHEFGHIMHQTLTQARYMSQSGTSVAGDFVEAPSQILQNWAWDKEILKSITKHYRTGKKMDDALLDSLLRSKNFQKGYFTARQLALGLFDMEIHSKKGKPINSVFDKYQKTMIGIQPPKGSIYPAAFGHFVGYQAGYYGYLWSDVYASDMFSRFKKEGILNSKTGLDYRKEILEMGSSREELESVKKFLGRKPNQKAFLKELGF